MTDLYPPVDARTVGLVDTPAARDLMADAEAELGAAASDAADQHARLSDAYRKAMALLERNDR